MSPVDVWAMLAAFTAAGALAMRSQMLRPEFRSLHDAPTLVYLSLAALGIVCGGYGFSILAGVVHALGREAVLLTALAIVAVVLFLNLRSQARARPKAAAR